MNIVNKLTLRQLKMNKRRTLVTIIGAIISVAMVTAVTVSVSSAMDLMKRVAISSDGNWHMRYHDMKAKDIAILQDDENVDKVVVSYPVGYSILEATKNSDKPYLFVRGYNQEGFELMPVNLIEGRLPKASNEIVIPEHLESSTGLSYKVGDKIKLDLGQRYAINEETGEKEEGALNQGYSFVRNAEGESMETFVLQQTQEYTIVGVTKKSKEEYSWSPAYELMTYISPDEIPSEANVTVSVLLKNLNVGIYEHNAALGIKVGIEVVEPNSELLACYGVNSDSSLIFALFGVVSIVLIIIMAGSISLIYNAFAISVAERSQYLGMLASVGATKKQKRDSVFFEGAVIGGISIPLGLLAGFLGMSITFGAINGMFKNIMSIEENLHLVVSPIAVISTVLISILTIFISTYVPARRASKISAIEAIRQTTDIKMNKKKVKTSKFTRRLFGFEGELALKNLKRNGRRYRATLFSLIISIILFLTTATFSAYMNRSLEMVVQNTNYDIRVSANYRNDVERKVELEKLKSLDKVEKYSLLETAYFEAYLPDEMTPGHIKEFLGGIEERGYFYNVNLIALENEALKAYAQSVGTDINLLNNPQAPAAIVLNRAKFKDKETQNYRDEEVIRASINDKLTLSRREWDEASNEEKILDGEEIAFAGFAKEPPMGMGIQENDNTLNLIVSEDVLNTLMKNSNEHMGYEISSYPTMYLTSKDPFGLQKDIQALQENSGNPIYSIYNIYEEKQTSEQIQTVIKVFIYGFIVLITLVSVANIFNTISTSIALRKREFSMLRSVGMTPKGFNKMINFESIFYGLKALLYGLPISFMIMMVLYKQLSNSFDFDFFVPVGSIITVIISVFVIIGASMFYSGAKVKGQNIIEGLKDTNL